MVRSSAPLRPSARAFRRPLRDALAVGGAALIVRLLFLLEYRGSPFYSFLHLDPLYYYQWAKRIAGGDWLGSRVFEQAPLYAYLLAGYIKIAGTSMGLLRILQFCVGAATAAMICLLGTKVFSRATGLAAGLLAAVYGPFLFYEGQVMKEFLTPFLSAGMLLAFYNGLAGGRRRNAWFFLAGLCTGAAALVRGNFLLLLPILGLYLLLARARDEEAARGSPFAPRLRGGRLAVSRFASAAFMAAGVAVWVGPSAIRNYAVSGDLVLTTSGGGEVFYIGNGPYANGAYVPPPWVRSNPEFEHADFRRKARQISGRDLSRSEASRFWWREGLQSIRDDPLRFLRLEARKAALFLDDYELPDNYSYYSFKQFSRILKVLPTFGIALALAAPGVVATAWRFSALLPLYLAGAGYMASVMLFFNFARFRLPFVPVLLLFAGEGIVVLGRLLGSARAHTTRRKAIARAGIAVTGAAAVFLLSLVDLHSNADEPFQDRLHLGAAYHQAGDLDRAEATYRSTIEDAQSVLLRKGWKEGSTRIPGGISFALALHSAHRGLASVLLDQHRDEAAIHELIAAIPFDPNDARLFQMLGGAYSEAHRYRDAETALRRGLDITPGSFTMRFDLANALYEQGRIDDALAEMQKARDLNPGLGDLDLADWHYGMGTILMARPGARAEAFDHFREGLRLNPGHQQAAEVRKLLSGRE